MKIVDTHQHLWDPERYNYPWLQSVPQLNRPFRMADYLDNIEGLDVVKSVHVEADVAESQMLDETRYIVELAKNPHNPLQGVVACARPENPDFRAYIEKIIQYPEVKGIRRILHTQPDELGRGNTFIANVGSLKNYPLSFDICVLARQLPIAINLVRQCPGVNFILDHCGVPQVKEQILDPWRENLRQLASFPNVSCKISGLVAYADLDNWKIADLQPYVDHAIACFGWDRVMFGSDWPVCSLAATLSQWVETLTLMTEGAGDENQQKLFHDNAIRIYRLS
jgi:predicted TIM-barrel fold metal-dependent hydrolase